VTTGLSVRESQNTSVLAAQTATWVNGACSSSLKVALRLILPEAAPVTQANS